MVYWNSKYDAIYNYEKLKFPDVFEGRASVNKRFIEELIRFIPSDRGEIPSLSGVVKCINAEIEDLRITDEKIIDAAKKLNLQFMHIQKKLELTKLKKYINQLSDLFKEDEILAIEYVVNAVEKNNSESVYDNNIYDLKEICSNYEFLLEKVIYIPESKQANNKSCNRPLDGNCNPEVDYGKVNHNKRKSKLSERDESISVILKNIFGRMYVKPMNRRRSLQDGVYDT